jgi:hypothetical protein
MTYRDTTRSLARRTRERVQAAYDAYVAGRIDRDELVAVVAATIAAGNANAYALADRALADQLAAILGRPQTTLGLAPPDDDADRLVDATTTTLDRHGQEPSAASTFETATAATAFALGRLAFAEPLIAGRTAHQAAMVERDVPGWTRDTGPSPCELCASLDDGSVLPPGTRMADHPGCACTARPVIR